MLDNTKTKFIETDGAQTDPKGYTNIDFDIRKLKQIQNLVISLQECLYDSDIEMDDAWNKVHDACESILYLTK